MTGARLPAALELVRALGAEGARVIAGDSLRFATAGFSRFAKGRVIFPAPAFDEAGFRSAVKEAVARHEISLVIPTSEEIFFLARMRHELGAELFAPETGLLFRLHSKWHAREESEGCGFRLPVTLLAASSAELTAAAAELPGGVLKPEHSRGSFGLTFLPSALPPCTPRSRWLVQERVQGRELTLYGVARSGELLAHGCYEPLYRVGAGASLYFRGVEHAKGAAALAAFARRHSYTGQVSFDVIEETSGELALLECNPRATSGVHVCGEHLGRALLGTGPANEPSSRSVAAKLAVALLHGPRAWSDLGSASDSCFHSRDPLPLLGLQLSSLELFLRSRFGRWRVPAARAFTYDLEWNGEAP